MGNSIAKTIVNISDIMASKIFVKDFGQVGLK